MMTMNQLKRTFVAMVYCLGGLMAVLAAENPEIKWVPLAELQKKWDPVPLSEVREIATGGEVLAQHYLGHCYVEGNRVSRDPVEGEKWYLRAMEAGYLSSANNLGLLYQRGLLGTKDNAKAVRYYRHAAERGLVRAQVNLGFLYEAEDEPADAFRYFEQAAESGDSEAMVKVYFHYWRGNGVTRDRNKAMEWLIKSAEAKNPWAECLMGYQCERVEWVGEGRDRHLTKPDMHGALRWYRRSAAQGWAGGQYYLGLMHLKGEVVARDEVRGLELMRAAADQDHDEALQELAALYARGVGEPRNESERPVVLLERAGTWNDVLLRYTHGLGADRDVIMAARAFSKLVLGGKRTLDGRSYYSPGDLKDMIEIKLSTASPVATPMIKAADQHCDIMGPPHRIGAPGDDVLLALSSYLKAARGDGAAALQLGKHYEIGGNAPQSAPRAWAWFSIAVKNKNPEAQAKLAALAGQMNREQMRKAQQWLASLQADLKELAPHLR